MHSLITVRAEMWSACLGECWYPEGKAGFKLWGCSTGSADLLLPQSSYLMWAFMLNVDACARYIMLLKVFVLGHIWIV